MASGILESVLPPIVDENPPRRWATDRSLSMPTWAEKAKTEIEVLMRQVKLEAESFIYAQLRDTEA